jgi:hypothetical protein
VIDIGKFEAYLARYEHDIRRMQQELPDHAQLELSYEDLIASPGEALGCVLDFLGVERRELQFQTVRQGPGELANKVANLEDVAAALRGTRWERSKQELLEAC